MSGEYNVTVNADDDRDDSKAAEIAAILCQAYPGHPWQIRIATSDGNNAIMIAHGWLPPNWKMLRLYDRITFDAGVLKREMVMAAGEFLERAGLIRGAAREGDVVTHVDGIPRKDMLRSLLANGTVH